MAGEPGGPGDGARRLVLTAGRLPRGQAKDGQLSLATEVDAEPSADDPDQPLPRHLVDELTCVASWLETEARRVRLVHCEGPWAVPVARLPRFEPARARARGPAGPTGAA